MRDVVPARCLKSAANRKVRRRSCGLFRRGRHSDFLVSTPLIVRHRSSHLFLASIGGRVYLYCCTMLINIYFGEVLGSSEYDYFCFSRLSVSSTASVGIHTNWRNPCLKVAACPIVGIPSITFGVHAMRCRVYANNTTQWRTMDGRICGGDPVARLAPFVLNCATYMRLFRTDGSHPPPLAGGGTIRDYPAVTGSGHGGRKTGGSFAVPGRFRPQQYFHGHERGRLD